MLLYFILFLHIYVYIYVHMYIYIYEENFIFELGKCLKKT